jgi:hypothetical protein
MRHDRRSNWELSLRLSRHGAASCRWRDPAGAAHAAGPPDAGVPVYDIEDELPVFHPWAHPSSSVPEMRASCQQIDG